MKKSDYPVLFFACFLTFAHRFFAAFAIAALRCQNFHESSAVNVSEAELDGVFKRAA